MTCRVFIWYKTLSNFDFDRERSTLYDRQHHTQRFYGRNLHENLN